MSDGIYTVDDVEFTRGSPFGEQWWKVTDAQGVKHSFAMWLDFRVPNRWPKTGDTVELKMLPGKKCYTGAQSYIALEPCAELVKIIKRADSRDG